MFLDACLFEFHAKSGLGNFSASGGGLLFFDAGGLLFDLDGAAFHVFHELGQLAELLGRDRAILGLLDEDLLDGGDHRHRVRQERRQFSIPFQFLQGISRRLDQALDVNAPAGQFGGETRVLPVASDSQAQLVLAHHNRGRLVTLRVLRQKYAVDARRADGL